MLSLTRPAPNSGSGDLSPTVRSLYRIFLRATSASVLHHSTGTRCLRSRYRPVFEQYFQLHRSQIPQNKRLAEIREWDERLDNTLCLLQNSATFRGLPHLLTRNLSLLVNAHLKEQAHVIYPKWDPARGTSNKSPQAENRTTALAAQLEQCMAENLELAEGTAKVVLGR
ncbi:hypothetical protein FRC08_009979 [Ceratobasidium sp. 394]|nr:hypothetical protein FRC08_009979 [Ceratobasidium sp. 394]